MFCGSQGTSFHFLGQISYESESEVAQSCHGLQPTRLLPPWDFPGKSTGVGCHCLFQFHANRTQIWVNVKESILFILKNRTTDVTYDPNGLIEARFTLLLETTEKKIPNLWNSNFQDTEHKQWNLVIAERWETNKVIPTISLANSLVIVSRPYPTKKESRQSP